MASNKAGGFCVSYKICDTPDKGQGVFVDAAIGKGTILWRHVPEKYTVYNETSLNKLLSKLSHNEAVYELTHMFGLPEFPGYLIRLHDDGVLINHSTQPTTVINSCAQGKDYSYQCGADSVSEVTGALLNDRFAMIATRDLLPGDELTHDYNVGVEDPPYYDALCDNYNITWPWL